MISRIMLSICLFALVVTLSSCEKHLPFEGEDAEPRLVINGTFSPDSIFEVELSNSAGYIDSRPLRSIYDGKVAIYNAAGDFIDSLRHSSEGLYRSEITAEINQAYTVVASAPSLGTASAQDIIPMPVPIQSWDTTLVSVTEFDYTENRLEITYTVADPLADENYYILELYQTSYYYVTQDYNPKTGEYTIDTVYYDVPYRSLIGFSTADQILLSESNNSFDQTYYYTTSVAYSDELFNGRTQSFRVLVDSYYGQQVGSVLTLELRSCSRAYYRYKRTLENYWNTEGDPFAQPAQVFNNIQGGLGIWAGYSSSWVDIGL